MENALLPVGVLAVLIMPAYHRCPWLLVPVGGAAIISHLMPETSDTIRSAAMGGMGLAVIGYVVMMVTNILQISSDGCQETVDWREQGPQRYRGRNEVGRGGRW